MNAGEKSIKAFKEWAAGMTDDDFKQIVYSGSLSRTEIAIRCGFAKSVLRQNPAVKQMLVDTENDLRARGILPSLTKEGRQALNAPKQYDKTASKAAMDAKRVAELEAQVLELKAKLARFQELSEVIADIGIDI